MFSWPSFLWAFTFHFWLLYSKFPISPGINWGVGVRRAVKRTAYMDNGLSLGCPSEGPQASMSFTGMDSRPSPQTFSASILPYPPPNMGDGWQVGPINQDRLRYVGVPSNPKAHWLIMNSGLLLVHVTCPAGGFQGFCSTSRQVEPQPSGTLTVNTVEGKRTWWGLTPATRCFTQK